MEYTVHESTNGYVVTRGSFVITKRILRTAGDVLEAVERDMKLYRIRSARVVFPSGKVITIP